MGLWDMLMGHHEQVYGSGQMNNGQPLEEHHKSSWTHELIAGAAAFEAMRAYEAHAGVNGGQGNHAFAKEMLAAVAAAEVDKIAETKGLDYIDRERAKQQAVQQAHQAYDERYVSGPGWGGQGQGQGQYGSPGQWGPPPPGGWPEDHPAHHRHHPHHPGGDFGGPGGYGRSGPQGGYGGPQGGYGEGPGPQGGYGGPSSNYNQGYGSRGGNYNQGPPGNYGNSGYNQY